MADTKACGAAIRTNSKAGVLLVLGAACLWSLNGALIKLVNEGGYGPTGVTIAFYRSLFAGLFLWPIARGRWRTLARRGGDERRSVLPFRFRSAALWCVVFYTFMTVCFVVANTETEAANAIILQYTSTFWIFGLSPLVLRESPHGRDIGVLILALTGIAIIFVGEATSDLFGLMNALASGLFYGLLTLMIRRMRDCDPAAVTVLNNLGSALLILPFVLVGGRLVVSEKSLAYLAFMGVVQFGLPYYLFSLGLARIPAYQASLITMAEPILVPVWAYLAIAEIPTATTMLGGGVVLLSLVIFFAALRRSGLAVPKQAIRPGEQNGMERLNSK